MLLTMEGFASYRERTVVDFRGADYFALVGPTGSGKSTVIDAMTFALFGSAPRWRDRRAVSYALAPSVNRGVVQFVFDVGARRYVAARELRRGAHGGVTVPNARLERLLDADGIAAPDEPTESLASGSGVSDEAERLLGLSFENFCQCVVLPQGQFADFLRARTGDRQDILLKLLGAERYERIMQAANTRASAAEVEAAGFAERLAELADATEDAERAATRREASLRELEGSVAGVLTGLQAEAAGVADARGREQALRHEAARLEELRRPPGTDERAQRRAEAGRTVAGLQAAVARAEAADEGARAAVAAAPDRADLQRALDHHRERSALGDRLGALVAAAAGAQAAHAAAEQARRAAQDQVADDRTREQLTAAEARRAEEARQVLASEVDRLRGVSPDAGAAALWRDFQAASGAVEELQRQREVAEQAAAEAAGAVLPASRQAGLESALGWVRSLAALTAEQAEADADRRAAEAAQQSAAEAVTAAQAAAVTARRDLDDARRADLAAALRPHLHVGARCPTCDQAVAVLPPPATSADLDAVEGRGRAADAELARAQTEERRRDRALVAARERVASVERQLAQGRSALTAIRLPEGVAAQEDALVAALAGAATRRAGAEEAAAAVARLLAAVQAASGRSADLGRRVGAARAALRSARDPLVSLGAPALDEDDLEAAWAALVAWAGAEASRRLDALAAATQAAATAGAAAERARAALAEAERALTRGEAGHLAAVQAREQAESAVAHARRRSAELDGQLRDAPPEAEVVARLAEAQRLEAARDEAAAGLRQARQRAAAAERELADLDARLAEDWARLRAARDALVTSGPPDLPSGDLAEAWATLLTWADGQRQQLAGQVAEAAAALTGRVETLAARRGELVARLVAHDLPEPAAGDVAELSREVSVLVARAADRAAAERERIARRREDAAAVAGRLREAQERAQVARLLGEHLRSNRFQRWLAGAALDTLVLDASARLSELSGGQYELTHERGDFSVVDHADADSRRSVRTLSGGETFQASLALALALSSQLGTFGAGASLDSILLDEGFGTLDGSTLDVVAGTLENLAGSDRMVGVVTHVPALAERIPVRFTVQRDSRTSTVVREDA